MKSRLFLISFIFLWSCNVPTSFRNKEHSEIKLYSYAFMNEQKEQFEVSFYAFIPYDLLVFTKKNSRFYAESELSLTVTDLTSNKQVFNYSWIEKVDEKFYSNTRNSKKSVITGRSFYQPEGEYLLALNVTDLDSRHQWNVQQKINVARFELCSDIVPMIKKDDSLQFVGHHISGEVDTLFCKFQVSEENTDEEIAYSILFADEVLASDTLLIGDISTNKTCLIAIPLEENWSGRLQIQLQLIEITKEVSVYVKRSVMDKYLSDIDEAVEIISIILSDKEIIELGKLNSMDKKLFIVDFWKKKDPSVDSDTNELMEEFYNRVEEANQQFSTYGTGWRTDRGKVYVVQGAPDNVETTRRGSTAIYQIWTYSDGRQFIFKDNGFGEFKLIQGIW